MLVFTAIWFTFAYIPIAHMVWFASETAPGLLNARGALDFAGGTVVHINAGWPDWSARTWWADASAMAAKRCSRTTCR